jgi:hypothetical protein
MLRGAVPDAVVDWLQEYRIRRTLPVAAAELVRRDESGLSGEDPGPERAIEAALAWLASAQDRSATHDGGVARHFSLLDGWAPSYPETTGYIIPTLLEENSHGASAELRARARRMLDWLLSIQFEDGSFQGGMITETPRVPVTFNTGQILMGFAVAARRGIDSRYTDAMHRAASWLLRTQDADGPWRRNASPFAIPGVKTYDTHVSWGLFEAERAAPGYGYGDGGIRQVRWALTRQHRNGWFEDCCLDKPRTPLTHTLGYALRGIVEAYRLTNEREFLEAALRTARGLKSCVNSDGRLPGRLDSNWNAAADWVCLTGSVQIAHSWLLLSVWAGDQALHDAAVLVTRYVRRTIMLHGDPDLVGGVRGSFPVSGDYGRFQFLNWAAKFFVDTNRELLRLDG